MQRLRFSIQVQCPGSLKFNRVQVRGEYFPPFMYKVYINAPLNTLTNHAYAIFINGLRLSSPSFADDIFLLTT